jgi:hypothetical protein
VASAMTIRRANFSQMILRAGKATSDVKVIGFPHQKDDMTEMATS